MSAINILVIGAGMYVCGRGTDGYGTIMPAIFEWKKKNDINDIYIAGNTLNGINFAKKKIGELKKNLNVEVPIEFFPEVENDPNCFKEAIRRISKPACAIVAVPDNLHKKIAEAAVKEGLHTLVVKPLVTNLKEAKDLIALQRKRDVYCAVEFHKRFDLANLKLKDCLDKGLIGDPLYFLVEFSQRKSVPTKIFKKWIKATNIFQYLGIHYVDIIYFSTKAKPIRAIAMGQKNWLYSKGIDAYDSITAVIEWKMPSGKRFVSHILTNWVDPKSTSAMSDQKIKVIGTKGRFESDQKNRGITIVSDEKGIEEPNPYFCSAYGAGGDTAYRGYGIDSIHQFLDDVVMIEKGLLNIDDLDNRRPTFKEALIPTMVLEAVNKSLRDNGKWIKIEEK